MPKIFYEENTETRDHETGEIKTSSKRRSIRHEQEPAYIKLYIHDICKLNDIPKTGNDVINELLSLVDYKNEIILSTGVKNRIRDKLGIKKGTLDNTLSRLTNKWSVLKKIDRGIYMLNPNIFGRGNWMDIKKLRLTWEYSENGRELKDLNIERNTEAKFNNFLDNDTDAA